MQHRRLIVTGRVQGVGFRDWTIATAEALGLGGWVRNRRDGSVEIHAAGEADALSALVTACRSGPAMAHVDEVVVSAAPAEPVAGFVRRTPA